MEIIGNGGRGQFGLFFLLMNKTVNNVVVRTNVAVRINGRIIHEGNSGVEEIDGGLSGGDGFSVITLN